MEPNLVPATDAQSNALSMLRESNGDPRSHLSQVAEASTSPEYGDPGPCIDPTESTQWDEMGRNDTGSENFPHPGPSSGHSQVQNPATDTQEWEEMGKNGNEKEKFSPNTPTGPGPTHSDPHADVEEDDSGTTYPELLRRLLEFLGAGDPEPEDPEKKISPLSARQLSALPYLAAFPNANQAARAAGIGKSTLYRWLEDDHFRQELTRLREETSEFARQELKGLQLRAVDVLRDALGDGNVGVRLRAARYSMSYSTQVELAEKLRRDVSNLQVAVEEWKSKRPVP